MSGDIHKKRVHLVQDIEYQRLGSTSAVFRLTTSSFGEGSTSQVISTVEGLALMSKIEAFCAGTGPAPLPVDEWTLVAPEYPAILQEHGFSAAQHVMAERGLQHPLENRMYTELVENAYSRDLIVRFTTPHKLVFNRRGEPLPQVYRCTLVTGLEAVYETNTIDFDARLSEQRKIISWKQLRALLKAHPQVQYFKADEENDEKWDYFLFTPTQEQEAALWDKQQSYAESGAWQDKGRALFDLDFLGLIAAGVLVDKR